MKKLVVFLTICFIFGCEEVIYKPGLIEADVLKEIAVIEKDLNNGLDLNLSSIRSIYFLEKLTGIESNAHIDDISHYSSKEYFKEDKNRWTEWSDSYADKIPVDSTSKVKEFVLLKTAWMGW